MNAAPKIDPPYVKLPPTMDSTPYSETETLPTIQETDEESCCDFCGNCCGSCCNALTSPQCFLACLLLGR